MKHGANIYKYAKQLKCTSKEIVDFSSNINFYNPKNNLKFTNNTIAKYPDPNYTRLKSKIAKVYELKKSNIALFNGATTAIFELIKSLQEKRIYLYAPLYGEYEKASKEKKIIKINRFENIDQKIKKNSIVVFVNPSTPDGKYYNLHKLLKKWMKKKCTIIIDESFLEFEGLKSVRNFIKIYKKLYIIQSFSKFYGCAGVRIGAVFSHKNNIKTLNTPLWNISALDEKLLISRLQDKKFKNRSKKLHQKQKKQLIKILANSNLFDEIYKSDANFILTKSRSAKQIFNSLLENKILTRDCNSFDFLDETYLRFGIKEIKKHQKLKKAIGEIS